MKYPVSQSKSLKTTFFKDIGQQHILISKAFSLILEYYQFPWNWENLDCFLPEIGNFFGGRAKYSFFNKSKISELKKLMMPQ